MQVTISQMVDQARGICGQHLKDAAVFLNKNATAVEEQFAAIAKTLEPVSQKSIGIVSVEAAAGLYFAGRACCSSKLSTTQRVATWAASAVCFAAAGYEAYANGVNLGLITLVNA